MTKEYILTDFTTFKDICMSKSIVINTYVFSAIAIAKEIGLEFGKIFKAKIDLSDVFGARKRVNFFIIARVIYV
jgi:hypothetical protein